MRTEEDFLGRMELPEDALFGINALRAKGNFPDTTPFHEEWYRAMGMVKLAVYQTYRNFKDEADREGMKGKLPLDWMDDGVIDALETAAMEVASGKYFDHFIVPAVSGGAGTSINMNVNEIIANAALLHLGRQPGDYSVIDPFLHANVYQSTNDVVPTALKLAIMQLLKDLELSVNKLRLRVEGLEKAHRLQIRMAFTQLQEAVPTTYGQLFSAYSDALSRDWWRISKAAERIKVVNLGGGAIGTGLSVPRYIIMNVVQRLATNTSLPVARGENLTDPTANLDSLVEVHAIIKAFAVNLEKISEDMRLLSSGMNSSPGISIPPKQVGSSVMPGKVNPVISEFVISVARSIYANDHLVTDLSARSQLDLNAFLPAIGHAMIGSLKMLSAACQTLENNLLNGLIVNEQVGMERVIYSPGTTTALSPYIGYHKAAHLAGLMKAEKLDIFQANRRLQLMDEKALRRILSPENLLKLGFSLRDISD